MKTIVISDIHLGIDDRIAENVKNRSLLIDFLKYLREEKRPEELVINGDFLDQWFLPASYDHVTDSDSFYRQVAENNAPVMEAFRQLMATGISLVYVPGNHDMTLRHEVLAELLPGIRQSRDVRGLGRYRTGCRGEIVIEHCHRYESFCAPDQLANREFMQYGEPILPPGYLFALIGVQSFVDGTFGKDPDQIGALKIPEIAPPAADDPDQLAAYTYYRTWKTIIETQFPTTRDLKDPYIKVNIDGFQGNFSIADLVPAQTEEGITARLYRHMQRNWEALQRRNLVPAPVDLMEQLQRLSDQTLRAEYARRQYLDLDPTVDVVVFGHTHVPFYRTFTEGYDRRKVYVNEGTWIDNNMDDPDNTASFAEIDSDAQDTAVLLRKCLPDAAGTLGEIVPVRNQYVEE